MLHNIRLRATISAFFIIAVCFLFSIATVQARAQNNNDLPDRADVQQQLTSLDNKKDLTPQEKLVQQDLTETLQLLDKLDRVKAESAQLQKQVAQAPAKLRQATDNLSALSDADNDDETRKTLSTLSLRQLEARVTQVVDDLQN
ncbi:MAG: mechanosensitive channel MscK, partial [Kluyvera sp.]